MTADDVGGIAVHIAARIVALAEPGEILVSGAIPPLVLGSGISFTDCGTHTLRGVPDRWSILAVGEPANDQPLDHRSATRPGVGGTP